MKLAAYNKKRNFSKTPEPKGKQLKTNDLHFYIQKHFATNLHYDLRLELDGVLKSWAVPKGPPNNPSEKRLAIMVEDHPIDYGEFEGQIPAGNYGAGKVILWDKGVYTSLESEDAKLSAKILRQGFSEGQAKFILHGNKLKGGYALIKLKGKDDKSWLLIKEKAKPALFKKKISPRQKDPMPHNVRPMLAKRVAESFDRKGWIFEIKWDGYRAISEITNGDVKLYSRNGLDLKIKYPSIVKELESFNGTTVLDGEIVALREGKPDFHTLQNYDESLHTLQYVVFDILYMDGTDLRNKPLSERKEYLKGLFRDTKNIIVSDYYEDNGKDYFNVIRKQKMEGIVAKDASSLYLDGTRSNSWLKVKNVENQEAIIIGFTSPKGGRKYLGALILGSYINKELKYIGHSGGGFTEKELEDLYKKLNKIKQNSSPVKEKIPIKTPITWVKPTLVCGISFGEWTPEVRMRHPIYLGLRNDKKPKEVTKEEILKNVPKSSEKAASGDELKISNPDKIYWPKDGYTKKDLIEYYDHIAEIILPYLIDRPQNLLRNPSGISKPGFFHKDINFSVPDFVTLKKIKSDTKGAKINYLLCQNKETLLFMANLGCIEINPWNSRLDDLDKPDYMIIDLDPGKKSFNELIQVAQEVHNVLQMMCADNYIKTSGKSGLHVCIPLGAAYT
jgi:bifunctional non-homologous end joining protein LigD